MYFSSSLCRTLQPLQNTLAIEETLTLTIVEHLNYCRTLQLHQITSTTAEHFNYHSTLSLTDKSTVCCPSAHQSKVFANNFVYHMGFTTPNPVYFITNSLRFDFTRRLSVTLFQIYFSLLFATFDF